MHPLDPIVNALVSRLQLDMREAFEERAGVLQFEAGRPRELAEPLALLDVLRHYPLAAAGAVLVQGRVKGSVVYALALGQDTARHRLGTLGATGVAPAALPLALHVLGGAARLTALP